MHILVLCKDKWHPAETPRVGLAPLTDYGFQFDFVTDAHHQLAERLAGYTTVILTKANQRSAADERPWVTAEAEKALLAYVQRGNGLLAIHSGTAGYAQCLILRRLLGGVFVSHPPQCPVTIQPQPDHPLSAGSSSFTEVDEHYGMELDDQTADVFVTTLSEHGSQPGGWCRAEGSGRVCVLTPGHNVDIWLHPHYQTLLRNALYWCSGLRSV